MINIVDTTKKQKKDFILKRMASLIRSKAGKNVGIKEGTNWCFDLESKDIVYPIKGRFSLEELPKDRFLGAVLHEIAHARYSDAVAPGVKTTYLDEYAFLFNSVEDLRIEHRLMQEFVGTYDSFSRLLKFACEVINEEEVMKLPPHQNMVANLLRGVWGVPTYFCSPLSEQVYNEFQEYIFDIYLCETSQELMTLTDTTLFPLYEKLIPKNNNKKKNKKSQKNDGEEGDQGDEVEAPPQVDDTPETANADSLKSLAETLERKLSDEQVSAIEQKCGIEKKSFMQFDKDELKRMFEPPKFSTEETKEATTNQTYLSIYQQVSPMIQFFSQKFGNILKDNSFDRYAGSYYSGKLNQKTLYRFRCKKLNLFKKKVARKNKKYAISLLVDQSGSMGGDRIKTALKSTVLLAEVLKKIGVEFEIRGFNTQHATYKKFGQPFNAKTKETVVQLLAGPEGRGSGGNNDGYEVYQARKRLLSQDATRILIVISDGYPNPGYGPIIEQGYKGIHETYGQFDLKKEVEVASKEIICIGIGIDSQAVSEYYPQFEVCKSVSELPQKLIRRLQLNIRRG